MRKLLVTLCIMMALVAIWGHTALAMEDSTKFCIENPDKCNQSDETPGNVAGDTSVTFMDYVKMVGALLFVIALIYGLLKFINQKGKSYQQSKLIHNLGGTTLGGNRSVQLIKVGDEILVVGVGENIQLLKEVEDPSQKEKILSFYEDKSVSPANWVSKFTTPKGTGSFQAHLKEQLEEMKRGRKTMLGEWKKKRDQSDE
ncbi:flagellar biosynthetic protein FliO [Bacillus sp. JRC01]|nr:flagellar biosynthetic protein FliO [Bacillus sp. JRC01]